jgi:hypothetical protein
MVCESAKSLLEYDSSSPDMASYDIQRHTPIILWHETPHSNTHIQYHPSNALRTPTLECTTLSPESSCVSTRHIKDSLSRGPLWSMNRCFRVCRAEEREGKKRVKSYFFLDGSAVQIISAVVYSTCAAGWYAWVKNNAPAMR